MKAEIPIALSALGGTVATVAVAFSFPALTEVDSDAAQSAQEAEYLDVHARELAYCQTAGQGLDCVCFARTAGMILAHEPARRGLTTYVSQRDLARSQARQKC